MKLSLNRGCVGLQALTGVLLVFCVAFLFVNADRGFELTDYSYYLLWAQQPGHVVASHFPFGYLTQVLYHLSGENIAVFRMSGVVLLLVVSAVLAHAYSQWRGGVFNVNLWLLLSATALMHYHGWLHEPSYNWLALMSVLLILSGIFYFFRSENSQAFQWVAMILVATGGVVAFYAKPTTAALMGLLVVLILPLGGEKIIKTIRFIFYAMLLAVFLLWASIQLFFSSFAEFFRHLSHGVEFAATLQAQHTMAEIWINTRVQVKTSVQWMFRQELTQQWFTVWAWSCMLLAGLSQWRPKWSQTANPWIQRGLFLAALGILLNSSHGNRFVGHHFYLLYIMVFALWCWDVFWHRKQMTQSVSWRQLLAFTAMSFLVLLASLAPSFGTNNHIVRHAAMSVVIMAMSVFVLLDVFRPSTLTRFSASAFAAVAVVCLIFVLNRAHDKPYRMPGTIADHNTMVQFVAPAHRLRVDAATASHVNGLLALAKQGGWVAGTPLLDMTGASPGSLVVLNARLVGSPWLIGGYKGSDVYVGHFLKHTDPQVLAKAWVLTSPEGGRRVSESLLGDVGLVFPQAYELLGQVRTGQGNDEHLLWKPR